MKYISRKYKYTINNHLIIHINIKDIHTQEGTFKKKVTDLESFYFEGQTVVYNNNSSPFPVLLRLYLSKSTWRQ